MLTIEILHGMFDADGNISAQFNKKVRKNGRVYVNVTWGWEFSQGIHNELNTQAIANLLNRQVKLKRRLAGRNAGTIEPTIRGTMTSESGQILLEMYRQTPPRAYTRIRQIVACDYCLTNFGPESTKDKANIVRELYIAKHISSQKKQAVEPIIEQMNLSLEVLERAHRLVQQDISIIDKRIQEIWNNVPNQRFTSQNILGAFVGDGSCNIVYKFDKYKKVYAFVPTFSITNQHREPLDAMKQSFGGLAGSVKRSGNNAYQFVLQGTNAFTELLEPIFQGVELPSIYKQNQWDTTIRIVHMLRSKHNKTFEGFCEIIDMSYALSKNQKRKHPIEYYKNREFVPK